MVMMFVHLFFLTSECAYILHLVNESGSENKDCKFIRGFNLYQVPLEQIMIKGVREKFQCEVRSIGLPITVGSQGANCF
jgi:hypothetical protein